MGSPGSSRKIGKRNSGSSSILVILIMVTLIVLGLIALMSTFSELKLARKNADWVKTYYVLDSKAENLLYGIDTCLKEAEEDAAAYISDKAFEKTENDVLPSNIQRAVNESWLEAVSANSGDKYKKNLYKKLYYMFSMDHLKASGIKNLALSSDLDFGDAAIFEDMAEEPDNGTISVSSTINEDTVPDGRRLLISISVKSDRTGRYDITSWKEIPKEFQYEDILDFEDLEVE